MAAAPAFDAPPRIPVLEASDLPGEEDWAVLQCLRFDPASEGDPEADRYGEVQVARGAFD
jgi:hypothetical protein